MNRTAGWLLVLACVAASCTTPVRQVTAKPAPNHIEVAIDFGPAELPPLSGEIALASQSTPIDAARALTSLEQDWLCCSKEDVWSIGGVGPDPRLDRYWFWRVNGRAGPTAPAAYHLEPGDRVEWIYAGHDAPAKEVQSQMLNGSPRVISLLPAATEIVDAVGGEAMLVGLTHLCPQPPGRDVPRVLTTSIDSDVWDMASIDRAVRESALTRVSPYRLDEELIQSLDPTLVISQGLCPVCAATPETVDPAIAGAHGQCPKLLVLSPHSLADVAENIREVGEAIGRLGAGRVAARAFERRIEHVRALPPPLPRPRVLVIEWFEPLWLSGEWIAEMVVAAGAEPVLVGPEDSSRRADWDELARADPDAIVLAACSMSVARAERELHYLTENPAWQSLRAVRSGHVYLMDGQAHFSTPGPRLAEGVELLATICRDLDGSSPPHDGAWRRLDAR